MAEAEGSPTTWKFTQYVFLLCALMQYAGQLLCAFGPASHHRMS
jgi:hypothetical protein